MAELTLAQLVASPLGDLEQAEAQALLLLWEHRLDKGCHDKRGAEVHRRQQMLFHVRQELAVRYAALPREPIDRPAIDRALAIARAVHHGQRDKIGADYIGHPLRVAGIAHVRRTGSAPAEGEHGVSDDYAVGLLHDVIEDGPFNEARFEYGMAVIAKEVSQRVAIAVHLLTRVPGHEAVYYERVRANPLARRVKAADIADNTDPRRMAELEPRDRDRLSAKYLKALAELGELG